ncbi:MAG: Glycoside hydrolase [Candidatus Tokpelaia hoelldobleri]|uniref:Glycoside hydrolase n=1 Tax=Candidatus Tokpelaia hoelldobleri TaxID=1902579 RepID=A0A1U9JWA9_9HYPH|nr:MAG: Glycoside hydrolase [Candidatus Tokpelaia hoelldoblerii]
MPVLIGIAILSGCAAGLVDAADGLKVSATPAPQSAHPATLPAAGDDGPRFHDHAPHEWGTRKPWHYAVHGIDVSRYQGEIDWLQVRADSVDFAFIKATEGGDRLDETFKQNWAQAKAAGVPRGAYHFYYFCRSAKEQAQWFIRHVPRDTTALPPVLDMEWNPKSPTCKLRPAPEMVRKEMRVFLDTLEKHYGKRPIIYTAIDFFEHNDLKQFKNHSFWLRSVAGHPQEKYGDHPWLFWQYTGTGSLAGITGDADINAFAGTRAEWQAWLQQQNE